MRLNTGFIRSKFSRRIFMLFILSAILPISLAAVVSYGYVSAQLRSQSYEQSRLTSKTIGMELLERLSLANIEFKAIAKTLHAQENGVAGEIRKKLSLHSARFAAFALLTSTNEPIGTAGEFGSIPDLDSKEEQQLAEGKSIIIARYMPDSQAAIMIVALLHHETPEDGKLLGIINPGYLWNVKDLLTEGIGLAISDPGNTPLFMTESFPSSILQSASSQLAGAATGHIEASSGESTYLIAFWTLFTDEMFSIPGWTIVMSQPERDALAPIINFRSIYIPMLMLVILAISFISANQIRKRLAPLTALKEATQRIAKGDFTGRVKIAGKDEFALLGYAFNSMAGRLEKQFKSLKTLAEIDRLILSSFDLRNITATVLGRACDFTPCSIVAMIEFSKDHAHAGRLSARLAQSNANVIEEQIRLSDNDLHRLSRNPHSLVLSHSGEILRYLAPLATNLPHTVLLLPMLIKQRLAAVIIFGYANGFEASEEEMGLLRKFADHVAVAFSNAMWEEQLYHQAHYDALTNLPNRALLADRLGQAIARARRNGSHVGIAFLDLDRFKVINDSLGHAVGDQLLKEIANLLTKTVRNTDTVVRFGGDEFIVIIPDIDRHAEVVFELRAVAEKILNAVQHKISLDSHKIYTAMSIGIAVFPRDGENPDELIKHADAAMYHAKEQGRGQYRFYSEELNAATLRRMNVEHELREALDKHEFELFYQAKVSPTGDSLLGAEALIRWRHPVRGLLSPIDFIDVAEETGLIHQMGEWVIQTACAQIKLWHGMGLPAIRIAVNVSSRQFEEDNLVAQIIRILKATRLRPDALELEVTESVVMANTDKSIATLKRLNDMGIRIAVDDFGTGYSSLSYLHRLPINTIKIDRSFTADMINSAETRAIVSASIMLAHQLGLDVVAEGVETSDQQALLGRWGCDELQGYLFSKPLPADEFEKLLRRYQETKTCCNPASDTLPSSRSG